MFFCENCRYSFNVTKDVKSKQVGGKINTSLTKLFDKIKNNEPLSAEDLENIKGRHILEDERYENMSKKDQRKIVSMIKAINKNFFVNDTEEGKVGTNVAYFICKYCKNFKPIKPGTKIYSKNYASNNSGENEDYTYTIYDNTLARTRNYICKNSKCPTHKDETNMSKEAILTKNSMDQVVYVCTVCSKHWANTL